MSHVKLKENQYLSKEIQGTKERIDERGQRIINKIDHALAIFGSEHCDVIAL